MVFALRKFNIGCKASITSKETLKMRIIMQKYKKICDKPDVTQNSVCVVRDTVNRFQHKRIDQFKIVVAKKKIKI